MNVAEFIAKWRRVELGERQAAQQHFLDLCAVVGHPTPAAADPTGESFCFERGAARLDGANGWADVWKRGFFGWEYKGKHKDLGAAYRQLLLYREDLDNPPLLVVCDMDRILVHTNFTNTPKRVYALPLEDLGAPRSLEILRAVFFEPEKLRPGTTSQTVTEEAARHVGEIAQGLRERGFAGEQVAHFLDRLVFCMFAEDVGLLPERLFTKVVENARRDSERLSRQLGQLFTAMATGGDFGAEVIRCFDGNLFTPEGVLPLTEVEVELLYRAALLDWSAVDASIFGTLFERGLDPDKRSQLGAHYTSRADIETLVEPVVMAPLRRDWAETRAMVENLFATGKKHPTPDAAASPPRGPALRKATTEADILLRGFLDRLASLKVLDPACGSGNFLYVTLGKLKDLEKEAVLFSMEHGLGFFPRAGPWQLHGIEVNPYAFELAQMTVWIGYLQWIRFNGFEVPADPILKPMTTFRCMDAILDLSDPEHPKEPEWPAVDFIVGNPPFLGGKILRRELGDEYVGHLFRLYGDRIPNFSDLCCYWFEKARRHVEDGKCKRAGLLATQGIRGGANRRVLERMKETGDIFFAESDRPWILDGANVHVSMVGFDDGREGARALDGRPVSTVNANLTSVADVTVAKRLAENRRLAYYCDVKAGSFDLPEEEALGMLRLPNPNERPGSDVLVPWINGTEVLRRPQRLWVVDFGVDTKMHAAALYEEPFRFVERHVLPERAKTNRKRYREMWWLHAEPCGSMRTAVAQRSRFLVTPQTSKHRVFAWYRWPVLPDHAVVAVAADQDWVFGLLHSRVHELWALRLGSRLETRPRYTPTTCFETFAFPWPPGSEPPATSTACAPRGSTRPSGPGRSSSSSRARSMAPGAATSTTRTPGASAPSAGRASSPATPTAPPASRPAPSPTCTTSAPPGSTSPTAASTGRSSPPKHGRPISPTTSSWSAYWLSTWSVRGRSDHGTTRPGPPRADRCRVRLLDRSPHALSLRRPSVASPVLGPTF